MGFNNTGGNHGGFANPAAGGGAAVISGGGALRPPEPIVIWALGFEGVLSQLRFNNPGQAVDFTWTIANEGRYFPFETTELVVARKMFVMVGGVNTGNFDVGIYDANLNRLVSSGSTAAGTINLLQEFDIADTNLPANALYYLAIAADSTTVRVQGATAQGTPLETASLAALRLATFPLPASAAAAVRWDDGNAPTVVPAFGLSQRVLVV